MLTQFIFSVIFSSIFFSIDPLTLIFLIKFFLISSFNIRLLGIELCNFFSKLLFMKLSQSHDSGRMFDKLTLVDPIYYHLNI